MIWVTVYKKILHEVLKKIFYKKNKKISGVKLSEIFFV